MDSGGARSQRILSLLSRADGKLAKPQISTSVQNAMKQGGQKASTLFEKFKSNKVVGKLGSFMGKLQLRAPIHLVDSMITYAIGVVSGMQDMAQVRNVQGFDEQCTGSHTKLQVERMLLFFTRHQLLLRSSASRG